MTELTGDAGLDAMLSVDCPRCKAAAGHYCRKPTGQKATATHTARIEAYETTVHLGNAARQGP